MNNSKPDIVLVMTDQHAARVFGCAGDPVAETPALDRLAAQGTRFDACYCPSPLCVPSRMAFLTGLEPHQTGVYTNDDLLPSDIPTIAHAMSEAGYDCRLIGRMHFNGPDQLHGFDKRSIGDVASNWPGGNPPDIGPLTKGRGNKGEELEFSGAGETSYQAYDLAVGDVALREIDELVSQRDQTGKPFFAIVSLFCPHPPFIARKEDYDQFKGRVPPARLPKPETEHPQLAAWREAGKVDALSKDAIEKSRTAYYGLVRFIDRIAGRIFERLEGRKDTVSIYTSDHGEALGERGLFWKSTMYDESAGVPLIIRAPDLPKGAVDHRVTSLMDLSRTLLGWAGTDLPGHTGSDLRDTENWSNQCTSSFYGGLMNIRLSDVRHRMVRNGPWKLVWFDGDAPLLFNLEDDPNELDDRSQDPACAEILRSLSEQLKEGWNPCEIGRQIAINSERRAVIKKWVKAKSPAEPALWLDPNPERNRYE